MSHWRLAFPANYLHCAHLQGKEVTVEIEKVSVEELTFEGGRKDRKPVVTFKGKKLPLVLNKTNARRIAQQHGPEMREWVGKVITLKPDMTKLKGEPVECIRVKEVQQ